MKFLRRRRRGATADHTPGGGGVFVRGTPACGRNRHRRHRRLHCVSLAHDGPRYERRCCTGSTHTGQSTVKARKLAYYYYYSMRKQGSCLEKEIMQGTVPGARRRGRPRTAWMDNIKTWTGLPVDESVRMT